MMDDESGTYLCTLEEEGEGVCGTDCRRNQALCDVCGEV